MDTLSGNDLKKLQKHFKINIGISDDFKIEDTDLFKSLGFDSMESLDYSNFEGASIIQDLNLPVPIDLQGKYDYIYDGGTLEHVFNFPQALKNVYTMLKTNGSVIHALPSSNHVDHGFYMFSPIALYEFYVQNNWRIEEFIIFEYHEDHAYRKWRFHEYEPGKFDQLSFGGWGKSMLGIFCVAVKTEFSTADVNPQQQSYVNRWEHAPVLKNGLASSLNAKLGKLPFIQRMIRRLYFAYLGVTRMKPKYRWKF